MNIGRPNIFFHCCVWYDSVLLVASHRLNNTIIIRSMVQAPHCGCVPSPLLQWVAIGIGLCIQNFSFIIPIRVVSELTNNEVRGWSPVCQSYFANQVLYECFCKHYSVIKRNCCLQNFCPCDMESFWKKSCFETNKLLKRRYLFDCLLSGFYRAFESISLSGCHSLNMI